jgi:hypothetical protein
MTPTVRLEGGVARRLPGGIALLFATIALQVPMTAAAQHGRPQHYVPPAGPPPIFENGATSVEIPIQISSNHIYVPVRIGNSDTPAAIVLDTGGGASAFDPDVVRRRGSSWALPSGRWGAGGETREAWLLGNVSYSLPGVRLEKQSITAISFRHLEDVTGRRMDSVLGADFLKQFVVVIDYAGHKLQLHDPKSYRYAGRATRSR